ncbi:MAG: hypothetical protein JOZ27_09140 [Caulobacteraceae bacterium]|nr:hypothetical protein [Caulobacteraceae bacterium]
MKHVGSLLVGAGLVLMFGFFGWAFWDTRAMGGWTGGSHAIAIMIAIGVVGVSALTGVLMWLAFYSARKGYDDATRFAPPASSRDPSEPGAD